MNCETCQKYSVDFDKWRVRERHGLPVLRDRAEKPLCRTTKGCPRGTPEATRSLSERNLLCYRHYLRCKAIGRFPEDPLVAYHARLIAEVERRCSESSQSDAIAAAINLAFAARMP